MQPVQALLSNRGRRPARREYGSRSRLRSMKCARTAAMQETGIVEAGHDGHQGVNSRTVFRHPSLARRAERWQA
jgi:hypothetical protein